MKVAIVFLALATVALAEESDVIDTVFSFLKDCKGDYSICVKEKVLTIVDNVRTSKSLSLVNGISLKANPEKKLEKNLEPLPSDPELKDAELTSRILDGVLGVAETHTLEFNLGDEENAGASIKRSLEEGRKKKKGGNGLGAIAMLIFIKLALKKLLLIKLLALKALIVGKIGLAIGVVLLLSHLLNQGHSKTTYEVVPHPHHSHESHHEVSHHAHIEPHVEHHVEHHAEPHYSSHGSGHDAHFSSYGGGDGWNKNIDEGSNLAYGGYSGHSRK